MKRSLRFLCAIATVGLIGGLVPSDAKATELDKRTYVTFNRPIAFPGVVLGAGTYLFEVPETSSGSRQVVRVWNRSGTEVYGTFLTIPTSRMTPTESTAITFRERGRRSPWAVSTWYYPGDRDGHLFVYPRPQTVQLARAGARTSRSIALKKPMKGRRAAKS